MFSRRPAPSPVVGPDVATAVLPSGDLAVAVGDELVGRVRDDEHGFRAVRPDGATVAVCSDPREAARVLLEHAS